MTDDDVKRLRALAERATPGPWSIDRRSSTLVRADAERYIANAGGYYTNTIDSATLAAQLDANAVYIAAASPDVLLALLDERDAMRRERDSAKHYAVDMADTLSQIQAGIGLSGPPDADGLIAAAKALRTERDAAMALLRECRDAFDAMPRSLAYDITHIARIDALLGDGGEAK